MSYDLTPKRSIDSFSSQPTASSIISSSSSIPPPPPLWCFPRVSQPSILLHDYVWNSTIVTHDPCTYYEASFNSFWQKAMVEVLQALASTHTWDLVYLPPNKSVVGCKWIYKIKTHVDGSIQ